MQSNDSVATLNHLFFYHLDHYRFDRLLSFQNHGELMVWSSERFSRSVFALRQFLLSSGLATGDRVALFSENRPEWHIADFALLLSRLVVVPVYNTLSPSQIAYILRHSGCRAAIIAGAAQWDILRPLLPELEIETIVGMEETAGVHTSLPRIVAEASAFDEPALSRIRAESLTAEPNDLATIVYTSGTTGTPKGVMLSHGNIFSDLRGSLARVPSNTAHQALSVLPLPHVLERTLSFGYFHEGVRIAYGDPHDLKELLPIHRPDIIGVVPRILEKVQEAVETEIARLVPHRRAIARTLLNAAIASKRAEMLGGQPAGLSDRLLARLANVLVFPKVHRQLCGLKYFISGGAWLNPDVEIFFRAAGFDVLQGYGMTETSPVIALNEYHKEKVGSVGPALPGVEARIGEDGEILTRGPHVMLGYYKDEAATRQAFTPDGWLHTGDLGSIDADGYVTITGRRKEILVLSNGKNVAYAPLEHALQRSLYIQQALVVGDGRKFVAALIVAHPENVARVATERGLAFGSYDELLLAPSVVALFRDELQRLQAEFSAFERVKRFCFLNEEALLDIQLVTPTQKVRRAVLERKYADWIGQMYRQEDPLVIPRPEQAVPAASYQP
jgi:long-chain acyl-CoA synthetase